MYQDISNSILDTFPSIVSHKEDMYADDTKGTHSKYFSNCFFVSFHFTHRSHTHEDKYYLGR